MADRTCGFLVDATLSVIKYAQICYLEVFFMKKRLLIASKQNINKIAYSVGYNEIVSFNRAFKKYYNKTPVQYRNELKKSE